MPRLFVALDFPEPVKDQLAGIMTSISGAKWVKREQLHLTLKFIGEVEAAQAARIRAALAEVVAANFDISLRGVGCFPPKGKPRVLWVGVSAPAFLEILYQHIEASLNPLGTRPDDYPFSAHVTLARFKESPPRDQLARFLEKHAGFCTEPIPITEFVLYSSVLTPQGPTYHKEQVYICKSHE